MRILPPFIPVRVESENLCHTVEVVGRKYTFGPDGMIHSIKISGEEILASPMRIVMSEDGEASVFDDNYPENESESFIQYRRDDEAMIMGCKQSERFILDFVNKISFDGHIDVSLRLMTRGRTVKEGFGLVTKKPLQYILDNLWLEIPIKKEFAAMYQMSPNSPLYLENGSETSTSHTSSSGKLPEMGFSTPFKSHFWIGDDERGIGFMSESLEGRILNDENRAMEVICEKDATILRVRLLDSHPHSWDGDVAKGLSTFMPISFGFAFMATPIKPFPKNPYIHKAFHIDCGIKVKGNYKDFFAQDNRFDLLVEKGVDTLILHEKWNKEQNWFDISEYTAEQLKFIVDNCHSRGIKVLVYFGYEISTLSPIWHKLDSSLLKGSYDYSGSWWRVPFQRAHRVCYASEYAEIFAAGVENVLEKYNIDGIYLDGTARPWPCGNQAHGCGWVDENGNIQPTYPIGAIRELFIKLYHIVKKRGGTINLHSSSIINYAVAGFVDQHWQGETLQYDFIKGNLEDMALDYFRAEMSGRNIGVPVEFIAYENRPLWNFENAVAFSILQGILPRPNDIDGPLNLMSRIWKIFDTFPIEKSRWMPYYKNNIKTSSDKIKVSYYKYTSISGKTELLMFVVNISSKKAENVTFDIKENVTVFTDAEKNEVISAPFDIDGYNYKIIFAD